MRERHQFFEIQDGGRRHVEFRLPGIHRHYGCVAVRSRNIPTKFGENWSKNFVKGITFSKFTMEAAAMLNSGY